jgi:chemotaxis protein MotA
MLVIVGSVVVMASVLGGFMMHHGPLAVLLQWNEFIIIGGTAIGALLISTPMPVVKQMMHGLQESIKGSKYTKEEYLNLLKLLFEVFNIAAREGVIALESHSADPAKSSIFSKNKLFVENKDARDYLLDSLKLMLSGGVPAHELETLLDTDLQVQHTDHSAVPNTLQKIGDSLPGIGIVAAVLGIIITMQAINGPPEEIGMKVAAALVGTFLGILLSYGYVQPLATQLDFMNQAENRYKECIKAAILAQARGNAPSIVVEFARRVVSKDVRPSFEEMEEAIRAVKAGGITK